MKGIHYLILAVAGMVGMGAVASGSSSGIDRSFRSAPGKTLTVDLRTGGDVVVTGGSGDEVKVKVVCSGRDCDDIDVFAEEISSGVEITSRLHGGRRNYNANTDVEVQVPSRYNISLMTMGGDVSIRGVEGEFSGKTMGGEISLSNLKGRVKLTTMGGEIEVADSELDGDVKTMGGNVTLRNVSGDLNGSTMGGNVRQEGSRLTGSKSSGGGEKRVHSMGGDLKIDSAPEGASLETMGGDIHVGSASDHVKAQTMGGDIHVDSLDGWADLTTMGGNVSVRMIGDPGKGKRDVEISSMGGDIELTLPDGISATFDLETEFSDHHARDSRIVSDFPLDVKESDDCRYDHRGRCYILKGTGKTGSGTHRIRIRTIEGDIVIRKSS